MLQFRESLKEGKIKYGNVRYLFTRMAANRFLKTKKRMSKFDFKDILPERAVGEKQYSDEEMQLLNKAWSQMGEACQQLLKSYFYDKIKMVELAKNASKTPAAIRKQKERCINVLRNNFLRFI